MRRLLALPPLLLTLLLAAGCGGGGESASEAWADDFCSAAAEWRAGVDQAIENVSSSAEMDAESVRGAIEQGVAATEAFVADVRALGPPETEAGQEAEAVVDSMSDEIAAATEEIRSTFATEPGSTRELLERLGQTAGLIEQVARDLGSSLDDLAGLEPGQELRDALEANADCSAARAGG